MNKIESGRKGGASRSDKKRRASANNGKRGGRPKIVDEFSAIPDRRLRYQLRQKKIAEMKDNA